MRSNERSECVKSSIILKQHEEVIEKTLDNFVNSMKLEPGILKILQNERHSYTSDREKLSNSLRTSASEIKNDLISIKSVINGLQEGRKIDVDNFKGKLIGLADKIREFKKNCSLEELTREEIELDQYLHEFSLTSAKYEAKNNSASSFVGSRQSSQKKFNSCTDCQDYRDIRDFDALVAKTGHTQNWSDEDHLFFLKVRKTSTNVPAMVSAIRKKCPDLSAERIVNHEAWYKIYLDLREKQRKTIKEWRNKMEMEKKHKVETTRDLRSEKTSSNNNEKKSGPETVAKELDPTKNFLNSDTKFSKVENSSTNCKKEMVARWRVIKNNAQVQEDEERKSELESRKVQKENRRLARAKRLKEAVSAYKEKKMEHLTASSTTSATDSDGLAKSEALKLLKSFRRQDDEFLKRRKALLASKKSKSNIPVRQASKSRSDGNSTLLNPTKGWLEKCKQEENLEQPQQILFVKDIPKLATYNWRNRESS